MIKRYGFGLRAISVGHGESVKIPDIVEKPGGDYVRYEDHIAEISKRVEQMEAIGAGGVSGPITQIKEHYRTANTHTPDIGKIVAPHGYRLVRLADIDTAIQRASVFDDGGDGADPESARSCIEILKAMIVVPLPGVANE